MFLLLLPWFSLHPEHEGKGIKEIKQKLSSHWKHGTACRLFLTWLVLAFLTSMPICEHKCVLTNAWQYFMASYNTCMCSDLLFFFSARHPKLPGTFVIPVTPSLGTDVRLSFFFFFNVIWWHWYRSINFQVSRTVCQTLNEVHTSLATLLANVTCTWDWGSLTK